MGTKRWSRCRGVGAGLLAGATALAMATTAGTALAGQQDAGQIRSVDGPSAISGSYLIVFKDTQVSAQDVAAQSQSLVAQHGGQVKSEYDTVLRGFSASMTAEQASSVAAESQVAYVEQDQTFHAVETQNDPIWNLDRSDQSELPLDDSYSYPDSAGAGTTSYIIDTGLRVTHDEFGDRASSGYDFVDDDEDADDCAGHGTHVAGTIGGSTYGVAKQTDLVGVRVLDCDGRGSIDNIVDALDWVADNAGDSAVANMSIGGGQSDALNDATTGLVDSGVAVAVAAGNEGQDACNVSPASVPDAITVGASNQEDARSTWPEAPGSESNYGECLDIWAPGTEVKSSYIDGDSSTETLGGTSMASPHIAGAAALHLGENPSDSPAAVKDALVENATSGELSDTKAGSPNELLNVSYLGEGDDGDDGDDGDEPGDGDAPDAAFTVSCQFGWGCSFDASQSTADEGIAGYAWDFGDGASGTGENVTHAYTSGGAFTATLTVTDEVEQTDTAEQVMQCTQFLQDTLCYAAQ